MVESFVFAVAAVVIVAGAVGVLVNRNPVHAALSLVATLFGVAVLFVALEANFLAAVQVIVYAGAIVVLFLFVIMLLGVDRVEDLEIEPFPIQRWLAGVVGVGVAGLIIAAVAQGRKALGEGEALPANGDSNIAQLAENLFSDHVFALEFTSILLIVAVVGTVLLTRKRSAG